MYFFYSYNHGNTKQILKRVLRTEWFIHAPNILAVLLNFVGTKTRLDIKTRRNSPPDLLEAFFKSGENDA